MGLFLWRRPGKWIPPAGRPPFGQASYGILALGTLIAQAGLLAVVVLFRTLQVQPFGGWDASAIWNLHARFIFLGGVDWPGVLRSPQIVWSHPDYPMLLPAGVARSWSLVGGDTPWAAAAISVFFGVATVALLLASVARLKSRIAGAIGGLVLLGTPFFVTFATSQYADIPLGYFVLATLAVLVLSERAPESLGLCALGGILAGLAAWTKNEGWLFVIVAALVWGVVLVRRRSFWSGMGFLCGLAVALIPVLYFKIAMAPPNDLVASRPIERLGFLFDGARHGLVLAAMLRHAAHFGEWRFAPFLILVLPILGGPWRRMSLAEICVGAAILLMLVGYYLVYLVTPKDLTWHVENSVDRLLLQLWPVTVFLWCLAAFGSASRTPSHAGAASVAPGGHGARWALFAALNLLVSCVILREFGRQLAPNELAATRDPGGEVCAVAGLGWFQREHDKHDSWVWCGGAATLHILSPEERGTAPVTLRFGMRSLVNRKVEVSVDGRILWNAQIGKDLSQVELAVPVSSGRSTDIVFSTDEPGVRESAVPEARSLAFALYDLTLSRKR